jgi:nucleoside-diphosphate-sugar epimerase
MDVVAIAVTGASGLVGQRLLPRLAEQEHVTRLIGLDVRDPLRRVRNLEFHRVDIGGAELKPLLDAADVLVHLATVVDPIPDETLMARVNVEGTRRVLEAAAAVGVRKVIRVSSAAVYGAWPNNPVPLTEDATLRPNPGFAFAAERAEIERLGAEWRDAHPGTVIGVLRPVRTAGTEPRDWLVPALRPGPAVPEHADDPPVQFVHVDDVAAAVDLARRERLDGAFNVAPDGSIPGDQVRSLMGAPPKVPLPERVAGRLVRWGFRWGLGTTPPELVPYTLHPWVVANDRLRLHGWAASVTNEEACVETFDTGMWSALSPRRRQEIALGVVGAGIAGVAAGGALLARRWLRR